MHGAHACRVLLQSQACRTQCQPQGARAGSRSKLSPTTQHILGRARGVVLHQLPLLMRLQQVQLALDAHHQLQAVLPLQHLQLLQETAARAACPGLPCAPQPWVMQ